MALTNNTSQKSGGKLAHWVDNLPVAKKLGYSFAAVVGVLVITVAINLLSNFQKSSLTDDLLNYRGPVVEAISGVESGTNEALAASRGYALFGDRVIKEQRAEAWDLINGHLAVLDTKKPHLSTQTQQQISELKSTLQSFEKAQANADRAVDQGNSNLAMSILRNEVTPKADDIHVSLQALITSQKVIQEEEIGSLAFFDNAANIASVVFLIIAIVVGVSIANFITRKLTANIKQLSDNLKQISQGDLTANATTTSNDEFGELMAVMGNMRSNLQAIIDNDVNHIISNAQQGNLSERIELADKQGSFRDLCAGINQILDVNRAILSDTSSVFAALAKGDLSARIVNDYQGEFNRIKEDANATVDTLHQMIQQDIRKVAESASHGDLSSRIEIADKGGFFKDLAEMFNQLIQINQQLIGDTGRVLRALTKGDLSQTITNNYQGEFQKLKQDANDTVALLNAVISKDIQPMVNSVAAGDLGRRIDTSSKHGFFAELSKGVNQIAETMGETLNDAVGVVSSLSKGDLTNKITREYQGDFSKLKENINNTIEHLQEVISGIQETADVVKTGAYEIAMGVNDLSERTETQASSLEETSASMEEMTGSVQQSAESARKANEMTSMAEHCAIAGGKAVDSTIEAMAEINQSSKKIADIIGVIDEIAFQTNLLALNAAVEAARAGEQGRGFAVVAGEVRTLAQRSAGAAKEIKDLINDSVARVDNGAKLVDDSGKTLKEIIDSVKQVSEVITSLATAAEQQDAGIRQVNVAISQMDQMTQQNAALVEESSAASQSMSDQAQNLASLVSFFKLSENAKPSLHSAPKASVKPEVKAAPKPAISKPVDVKQEPAKADKPVVKSAPKPAVAKVTPLAAKPKLEMPKPATTKTEPKPETKADTSKSTASKTSSVTELKKPALKTVESKPKAAAPKVAAPKTPQPKAEVCSAPSPSPAAMDDDDGEWEEF